VTRTSGIPASEAAELEGLRYQVDQARGELSATVSALAGKVAHRPPAGQVARRLAGTALRRLAAAARQSAWRGLADRAAGGWAPTAAVAGGALALAVLAAVAARHGQRRAGRSEAAR
jgi:hypothetical protein